MFAPPYTSPDRAHVFSSDGLWVPLHQRWCLGAKATTAHCFAASMSKNIFGHNRSRSYSSQCKLVTSWHLLGIFLNKMKNILYNPLNRLISFIKTWLWISYILNLTDSFVTTLNIVYSVTYYLKLLVVIFIYYISHFFSSYKDEIGCFNIIKHKHVYLIKFYNNNTTI